MILHHYTNKVGYNAVVAAVDWTFKASQPPGDRPVGAYITDYPPATPRLAKKLGIPRSKLEFVFQFHDAGNLKSLNGERGAHIFYSPNDHVVTSESQVDCGHTGL